MCSQNLLSVHFVVLNLVQEAWVWAPPWSSYLKEKTHKCSCKIIIIIIITTTTTTTISYNICIKLCNMNHVVVQALVAAGVVAMLTWVVMDLWMQCSRREKKAPSNGLCWAPLWRFCGTTTATMTGWCHICRKLPPCMWICLLVSPTLTLLTPQMLSISSRTTLRTILR